MKESEDLKNQLAILKKQNEEYLNGWKRAKADYINFKKETEERNIEFVKYANAALVLEILPIFEHMKLAVKHIPEEDKKKDWVVGVVQIEKQFRDMLKSIGLEEVKTVNESFNPEFHEAVAYEEKEGFKKDVVFEEVKAGYTLHNKVIIAAKVKVAK